MTDHITEAGRGRPRLVLYASIRGELATRWRHHAVEVEQTRPKTRGDCIDGPRPCPWSTCRHHMPEPATRAKRRRPLARLPVLPHQSCALDVADEGPAGLEEIGAWMGVSRERIRQIEAQILRDPKITSMLREYAPDGAAPMASASVGRAAAQERAQRKHISEMEREEAYIGTRSRRVQKCPGVGHM